MPTPILWLILVVGLSGLTMLIVMWAERRAWHRYEQWKCPHCGKIFGKQEPQWWARRTNPAPKFGGGNQGPVLRCNFCNRGFRFSRGGKIVSDESETTEEV